MLRKTYVEADMSAIGYNMRAFRAFVPESVACMAVVKADAYGHGLLPCAMAALRGGASWLAVAIPEEGVLLREADVTAPVLVLGATDRDGSEASARLGLSQTVATMDGLRELLRGAKAAREVAKIHLKIDTGMNRIGICSENDIEPFLQLIEKEPLLRLEGVFTHCCDADDPNSDYTLLQLERFQKAVSYIRGRGFHPLCHMAATAALLRYPECHFDMVRVGIGLYGVNPWPPSGLCLREALRWVAPVAQVKWIQPGETVGYGRTFAAKQPTRVATVEVGYGDGYRRDFAPGCVLVRGKRAKILGRVCMDQIMVDVTEIPEASIGDEAVLLGQQGSEAITGEEIAAWADTIPYEIYLSPKARVPRLTLHG